MLKPEEYNEDILKGEESILLNALNKYVNSKKIDDSKLLVTAFVVKLLLESSGFILDTNITELMNGYNNLFPKKLAERTFQNNFKFALENGYFRKEGEGNKYHIIISPSICKALKINGIKFNFRVNEFEKRLDNIANKKKEMKEHPETYKGPKDFKGMLASFRADSENKTNGSLSPNTPVRVGSRMIPYYQYEKLLIERKERRESLPKDFYYPKGNGNRPPRGNIYEWAERKEQERIQRMSSESYSGIHNPEDVMRELEERRQVELEASIKKATAEARESRRISGPISLAYESCQKNKRKTAEQIIAESKDQLERSYQKAIEEKNNQDGGKIVYIDTDYEDE